MSVGSNIFPSPFDTAFYVENPDGSTTLWSFEGSSPVSLIGRTGATFEPGNVITFMYCPLVDGRPGGHLGWAQLADGSFINPSDGGCNGDDANIERWKGWIEQGFTSSTEASAAAQWGLSGPEVEL